MPSPFPGMNPYLEQDDVWHDFHEAFLPTLREHITRGLPTDYIVKIDEHVYIHEPSSEQRRLVGRGDVHIGVRQSTTQTATAVAETTSAPATITLPSVDVERLSFLEIRDRRDRRLVTVIELLSPTNKYSGPDREQYLGKRGALLNSSVHLVELDLLRGGPRMPFAGTLPAGDYFVLVSRMETRPQAELWPITLRERLPNIPIPLRESDADVIVDLQAILHHVYDGARYGNYIYDGFPQPALNPTDTDWANLIRGESETNTPSLKEGLDKN